MVIFNSTEQSLKLSQDMLENGLIWLPKLLLASGSASSTSDARRLIQQGAVKVGGEKIEDPGCFLKPVPDMIIQVGKRKFTRIVF